MKYQMDKITICDATPMFADVISGAVLHPEPFHACPELDWRERPAWWHWATKTQAGRRALSVIGCTVDVEKPWVSRADGWRIQPWVDANEPDTPKLFGCIVDRLREVLGDPSAGTFFAEICLRNPTTVEYERSNQTMIAINVDGTRAAIAQLAA